MRVKTTSIYSVNTKVAGVTYDNPDGKDRQSIIKKNCKQGMNLILKREPDNPYDKNAVGVWIKTKSFLSSSEDQIGYLKKMDAKLVSDNLGKNKSIKAKITNVTGGTKGKETRGVNIEITIE